MIFDRVLRKFNENHDPETGRFTEAFHGTAVEVADRILAEGTNTHAVHLTTDRDTAISYGLAADIREGGIGRCAVLEIHVPDAEWRTFYPNPVAGPGARLALRDIPSAWIKGYDVVERAYAGGMRVLSHKDNPRFQKARDHVLYAALPLSSIAKFNPYHVPAGDEQGRGGQFTSADEFGPGEGPPATPGVVARQEMEMRQDWHVNQRMMERRIDRLLDQAGPYNIAAGKNWYAHEVGATVAIMQSKYGVPAATVRGVLAAMSPQTEWWNPDWWSEKDPDTQWERSNQDQAERVLKVVTQQKTLTITEDTITAILTPPPGTELTESKRAFAEEVRQYIGTHRMEDLPLNIIAGAHPDLMSLLPGNVAKAVEITRGADPEKVLGGMKVRSFYHNMSDPKGSRDVTIDTHMVRALLNRPDLPGDAPKGQKGASDFASSKVRYRIMADAIRTVAARRGLRPLEVQAVVWKTWRDQHHDTIPGRLMHTHEGQAKHYLAKARTDIWASGENLTREEADAIIAYFDRIRATVKATTPQHHPLHEAQLIVEKYREDQARDDHGRWTDEGGGFGTSDPFEGLHDREALNSWNTAAIDLRSPSDVTSPGWEAWEHYIRNGYEDMNMLLRSGKIFSYGAGQGSLSVQQRGEAAERDIAALDAEIAKHTLSQPIVVMRGMDHGISGEDFTKDWRVGTVVRDKGFVSTSTDPSVTNMRPVKMRIRIPAGAHGLIGAEDEREIILPRNTRFRITRLDRSEHITDVWMEVVP